MMLYVGVNACCHITIFSTKMPLCSAKKLLPDIVPDLYLWLRSQSAAMPSQLLQTAEMSLILSTNALSTTAHHCTSVIIKGIQCA